MLIVIGFLIRRGVNSSPPRNAGEGSSREIRKRLEKAQFAAIGVGIVGRHQKKGHDSMAHVLNIPPLSVMKIWLYI